MVGDLITGAGGELLGKVGGIVDDLVTTKEEKLSLKAEMKEMILKSEEQAAAQVTARWDSDMNSDNWLSKNIRPMALIFFTIVFVIISFSDGNIGSFAVKEAYIPIYQTILLAIYGAYFAGRTFEKYTKSNNITDAAVADIDRRTRKRNRKRRNAEEDI